MAEQKLIFKIKVEGDKQSVTTDFDPPISDTEEQWTALPEDEKKAQASAFEIADFLIKKLNQLNDEHDKKVKALQ